MKETDCVLVILNKKFFEESMNHLVFDNVKPVAILTDEYSERFFELEGKKIPMDSFFNIDRVVNEHKNSTWIIIGDKENGDDLFKIKSFLIICGIEEQNIVYYDMFRRVSPTWLANYHYLEKNGADFFATGDDHFRDALNLNFIPSVNKSSALGGVNLADVNQNLQQSYLIAKNIFAHVKAGTIKFVLIGLSPNYFYRDCSEIFFDFKNKTDEYADLNFDEIKNKYNREFSAQSILDWKENLNDITCDSVEKNIQILKNYIKLCLDNGAKPVGVIFPFSSFVRKTYDKKILNDFREIIHRLEENYNFTCVDMFELNLDYHCFCDMVHLNSDGSMFANAMLSVKLCEQGLIPVESFHEMNYQYLNRLAWIAGKDEYNAFAEKIFNASVQKIRRKDKIKIGFVVRGSAEWCGDDLYNLFARDNRFEVTVFSFLAADRINDKLFAEDFWHGIEQFKQRGLNIVALDNINSSVQKQDVFIFLSPYFHMMPLALRPKNLPLETLITDISYSFNINVHEKSHCNSTVFNTAWKVFFSSQIDLEMYVKDNTLGMPRGLYSGYPRTDIFFENNKNLNFDWKMTRPDAKKIIYAPHWSVYSADRRGYATFQWNHKFMYEFAETHPEISFVYKPHPLLCSQVIRENIFPSNEAYEEYLQKWNELPNAQVYTGAYYQAIFVTSDGMIHDSGSFIAEYQFMNKPMIFLTREGEKFNDLGKEILNASYLVDGKDFDGIADMMKRVFIEGDDYKAAERQKVFDKHLNYFKYNGMSASEFMYKSIADDLKEESKS